MKVTILLEELLAAGHKDAEYDAWLIRISEGDQFGSGFVALLAGEGVGGGSWHWGLAPRESPPPDKKPDAFVDHRSPFRPIATRVPGMRFTDLLPHTADVADKLAVVRGRDVGVVGV